MKRRKVNEDKQQEENSSAEKQDQQTIVYSLMFLKLPLACAQKCFFFFFSRSILVFAVFGDAFV